MVLLDTCVVEGVFGDINAYMILKQQNTTLMGIKGGCPSKNPPTYLLEKIMT